MLYMSRVFGLQLTGCDWFGLCRLQKSLPQPSSGREGAIRRTLQRTRGGSFGRASIEQPRVLPDDPGRLRGGAQGVRERQGAATPDA